MANPPPSFHVTAHFHRSPSPREIDDLPAAFHCGSPGGSSSSAVASSRPVPSPRMDVEWSSLLAAQAAAPSLSSSVSNSSSLRKRSRDDLEGGGGSNHSHANNKGKGKQTYNDMHDSEECTMDHDHGLTSFEEMGLPISLANASLPPHHHRPHHPQNEQHAADGGATPFHGFGVKGTPGGDCKRICLRHQRMVDAGARLDLQKVGGREK